MNDASSPKRIGNGAEIEKLFRAAKAPLRLLARLGLGGLRPLRDYNRNNQGLDEDFTTIRHDLESTSEMLVKYHLFSWELGG